tara:strand:+ start:138 stop:458 length:321 start_codon:yes stop_codon:yes gene_type:complete
LLHNNTRTHILKRRDVYFIIHAVVVDEQHLPKEPTKQKHQKKIDGRSRFREWFISVKVESDRQTIVSHPGPRRGANGGWYFVDELLRECRTGVLDLRVRFLSRGGL